MSIQTTLKKLQEQLDLSFTDELLLLQALIHPSLVGTPGAAKKLLGHRIERYQSYERLEFLGDRVLNLVIAEWLLDHYAYENEGDIAKRHAHLVQRAGLLKVAKILQLGDFIQMAEMGANDSMLADATEALLGAIYKDQGFESAKKVIIQLWKNQLGEDSAPQSNMKSQLQEWLQEKGRGLPEYRLVKKMGSDHEPLFEVAVHIQDMEPISAIASSKKMASIKAATLALKKIGVIN